MVFEREIMISAVHFFIILTKLLPKAKPSLNLQNFNALVFLEPVMVWLKLFKSLQNYSSTLFSTLLCSTDMVASALGGFVLQTKLCNPNFVN